jgi:aspartyl-tRNA(Asn)/glutamyl-tRNA(Gln) amidotransferase subunit B
MAQTNSLLVMGYEVVIGIETHTQLSTASKMFSNASTAFGAAPNTQATFVDLALPGVLPVANHGAIDRAIAFGLAIGATVAERSIFARKNYFYPDLPKGYQISQYELPVVQGGVINFFVDGVPHALTLTRAHLEEDAGKSVHGAVEGMSGIDLNRAGTPLLEIVTEPDLRSSKQAAEYARALHSLVQWLGICDGNLQEGSFRCDANVSVRKPGAPYGTRTEIKNINSFRFIEKAIDYEVRRQIELIEDGGKVVQETRLYDADRDETRSMRSKEDAHDYRYFPDPDLPPLVITQAQIDAIARTMPELPRAMAARFERDYELAPYDAAQMTQSKALAAYFEACAASVPGQAKQVANWLMTDVSSYLNREQLSVENFSVSAPALGALIARVADGTISHKIAKDVFAAMCSEGQSADAIIESRGLKQISDSGAIEKIVDEVIAAHPQFVAEYKSGKAKAFNALVGQVMKASGGKANPAQANALLKAKLD